jgi:hypothetical protein
MGILMFLLSGAILLCIAAMFEGVPRNNYWIAGDIGGGVEGSSSSSKTKVTATKEEKELNKLDLELRKAAQGGLMNTQDLALKLSGQFLSGKDLPGYFEKLPYGISPEVTQDLVDSSMQDIATSAQFSGILDSGTAGEIAGRSAADIRTQSEQFNIENLLQLLNLATGNYAQAVSPSLSVGHTLGQRLAGLRSTTTNASSFGWNANAKMVLAPSMSPSAY